MHELAHRLNEFCGMQDAVARAPKFLVLYKRTGQRVIINHNGDMLVRPSFIESSLLQLPCGTSRSALDQHEVSCSWLAAASISL